MEEGSLLHEVLHQRGGRGVLYVGDGTTRSTLIADVHFLALPTQQERRRASEEDSDQVGDPHCHDFGSNGRASSVSQSLDSICAELNAFVDATSSSYPWFIRRPRFATHVVSDASNDPDSSSSPIEVLRAIVEYGLQVTDEWMMVHLLLTFTEANPNLPLAVECWDEDDGQILLIEVAHTLPDWADSEDCRHRCWIQAGQVRLLSPASVPVASLELARESLGSNVTFGSSDPELLMNRKVTDAIRSSIRTRVTNVPHTHRALVYLPRSIVETFMKNHSHLVGEVVAAFVEHATSALPSGRPPQQDLLGTQFASSFWSSDWIWTTIVFGRTHYALLRQFSSPSWPECDGIPSWFVSSLTGQFEQSSQTPLHLFAALDALDTYPSRLKHGLCVGVRLVMGLQYMCTDSGEAKVSDAISYRQRNEWARLKAEIDEWRATNSVDIDGTSRQGGSAPVMPAASEVDDEDWMNVTEDEMNRLTKIGPTDPSFTRGVESIVGGVRTFLNSESDAYGIDTRGEGGKSACNRETELSTTAPLPRSEVDPVVVLNLLHAALKAPTADDLILPERATDTPSASDPFFSEQDYHDLMEKNSSDGDDDDSTTSSISDGEGPVNDAHTEDAEMRKLMNAMDQELRRTMDVTDEDLQNVEDPETIESMHLLSNLLQSLESSSGPGDMGPLQSMLREMGIQPDL